MELSLSRRAIVDLVLTRALHVLFVCGGTLGASALLSSVSLRAFAWFVIVVAVVALLAAGLAALSVRGDVYVSLREWAFLCGAIATTFVSLWSALLFVVLMLGAVCLVVAQVMVRRMGTTDEAADMSRW